MGEILDPKISGTPEVHFRVRFCEIVLDRKLFASGNHQLNKLT
jgi:hypothetical protein